MGDIHISSLFETFVDVKLLVLRPIGHAVPNFCRILARLHDLLPNAQRAMGEDPSEHANFSRPSGISIVGFAFFMQMQSLSKIDDLIEAFDFVDGCNPDLRKDLLQPLDLPEFEADMLVRVPWLAEYEAKTIQPDHHSPLFQKLERISNGWNRTDVAVSLLQVRGDYPGWVRG